MTQDESAESVRERDVPVADLFRATLDAVPDAVIVVDAEGCITAANVQVDAVKFTPTGGRVDVSVSGLTDSTVVTVKDTGPGIEVSEQKRVFERLYRGRDAASSEAPGTGLGLALVDEILDAHHGSVSLQSIPGDGTAVTIQVPHVQTGE